MIFELDEDEITTPDAGTSELAKVLGGVAGASKQTDYAVDEALVVAVPNDREAYEDALRWRLEADRVREHVDGDLSSQGSSSGSARPSSCSPTPDFETRIPRSGRL